ncbi:MAG: membrane dipeptidase [Novosphingobium sp. 28-62-57]|uniref:dipeptidase n=1 Tax=unclassified Novosphingobium TaxID=2644732 RepID=UPI000BD0CF5B|nr:MULTISPECIES: dipeptidase [unclassified Novosphingobium]OYW48764.1 MAG: membrane dipeptidase [Novosphingobium sp. 12-62-10]OYZ08321.1 MAG: membrane dipeptidase [Novosphingobium sp. 28-62-57]OZA36444.1 MAG: membrane dipeptidase [Novosphingobium sp. 17-62-9]HQS70099.1 dipeptidase [Novosphingobium sp.]
MKHALILAPLALALIAATPPKSPEAVADAALRAAPVFDGHNDVPEQLRERRRDMLEGFDFRDTRSTGDAAKGLPPMMTDITRMRTGKVGAQFWSVYVSANLPEPQAVQATLEQIDVTRRLIAQYPADLQLCTDSKCVEASGKAGRIASLIGMEGGHSIGGSLAVLRQMHSLGARYMTLTHFKNTAWADSATDAPAHDGLTPFGEQVVREMQRLGMLVDLAHVSEATMRDALALGGPPPIVSHSNARAINHHSRNVSDETLKAIGAAGGIVMVNFYPPYVVEAARQWSAARDAQAAQAKALNRGDPAAEAADLAAWDKANPMPRGTVGDVADHIQHIAKLIGADHVGLGGDLDGVETTVAGLEDVSTYPTLFTELARRGWSQADLEKLASRNMLRVMKAAEAYAAAHRADPALENPTTF